MKLLVVADLHYSLKQFDWLIERAADYDAIVIAGDVLDLAGHADLDTQIVVVSKYLHTLRMLAPVIVCSGNHDGDIKNEEGEFVADWLRREGAENLYVDGDGFTLGGTRITVCPWWDGPVTQKALGEFLESEAAEPKDRWIWIYHSPPDQSRVSWTGKGHYGDKYLVDRIKQYWPECVLSGHVHNSPFRGGGSWIDRLGNSWVFNPGRQWAPMPSFIELDLLDRTATWVSLEDTETIDLTNPLPT